jgi:riboflavin biosynthesis pyrimidine reductase
MDNRNNSLNKLLKLFPSPLESVALKCLYLKQGLQKLGTRLHPFVYTNFIVSLDGRISLEHPQKGTHIVPDAIANPRDWRLFQELAAQADILITSGRYIRQLAREVAQDILPISDHPDYADLIQWRRTQKLPPQPAIVVVSASLNIPFPESLLNSKRLIYVATSTGANPMRVKALKTQGVRVLFAGNGPRVQGRELVTALGQEGFTTIYVIAGPEVLRTLLSAQILNRLYLTHALRVLGGESFDTLLEGEQLAPPADFALHSLYYDNLSQGNPKQIFAIYERLESAKGTVPPKA